MSFGICQDCSGQISIEEFNAARYLRPTGHEPVLCFACLGKLIVVLDKLRAAANKLCLAFDSSGDEFNIPGYIVEELRAAAQENTP